MIFTTIGYIIGLFLGFFAFLAFFRPLFWIVFYKIKMGNRASIFFYPLKGISFYYNKSFEKYGDSLEFFRVAKRQNPNLQYILTNVLFTPNVLMCDEKSMREFNAISTTNTEKIRMSIGIQTLFKDSVNIAHYNQWKVQRGTLTHYFNFDYLKNFVPMIESFSIEKVKEISDEIEKSSDKQYSPKNLIASMSQFAYKVIAKFLFTENIEKKSNEYSLTLTEKMHLSAQLSSKYVQSSIFYKLKVWLFKEEASKYFQTNGEKKVIEVYDSIRTQLMSELEQRKQEIIATKENSNLLDELINKHIKNPDELSLYQIMSQQLGILAGGLDTQGYTLAILCYFLSQHEDSQKKLREEIQSAFVNGQLSYDRVQKLNYLTAAIKESLRVFSRAPIALVREIKKEIKFSDGVTLLKGHFAQQLQFLGDQFIYEDDYKQFKPERWLRTDIKINQIMMFSTGPRNCIGQHLSMLESKIMCCHLIHNFNLLPVKDYNFKSKTNTFSDLIDYKLVTFQKISSSDH